MVSADYNIHTDFIMYHTCMCTWTPVPLSSHSEHTEVGPGSAHFLSDRGRGLQRFLVVEVAQSLSGSGQVIRVCAVEGLTDATLVRGRGGGGGGGEFR